MKQIEEYEDKRERQLKRMRSLIDYSMGFIIILVGVFFLFLRQNEGIFVNRYFGKPDISDKVLGGACVLYGGWRIYRGVRKKYFR